MSIKSVFTVRCIGPGEGRADMVCRAIFRKYVGDEILILEAMKTKQDGQVPTCERIRWVASIFRRTPYMLRLVWTTLWSVGDFSEICWRWNITSCSSEKGGSVAEWLACWTQTQKGPGSNSSRDAVVEIQQCTFKHLNLRLTIIFTKKTQRATQN